AYALSLLSFSPGPGPPCVAEREFQRADSDTACGFLHIFLPSSFSSSSPNTEAEDLTSASQTSLIGKGRFHGEETCVEENSSRQRPKPRKRREAPLPFVFSPPSSVDLLLTDYSASSLFTHRKTSYDFSLLLPSSSWLFLPCILVAFLCSQTTPVRSIRITGKNRLLGHLNATKAGQLILIRLFACPSLFLISPFFLTIRGLYLFSRLSAPVIHSSPIVRELPACFISSYLALPDIATLLPTPSCPPSHSASFSDSRDRDF
ncbi:hypothetical protein CSUI_000918, partial [Cystoisospora suis]